MTLRVQGLRCSNIVPRVHCFILSPGLDGGKSPGGASGGALWVVRLTHMHPHIEEWVEPLMAGASSGRPGRQAKPPGAPGQHSSQWGQGLECEKVRE